MDFAFFQFLQELSDRLDSLTRKVDAMAKTLQEVLDAVAAEDTKIDGIIALVGGLKQQLADALSGTTLPPDVQAKVDALFDKATASAGKIDAALSANVPPA